MAVLSLGFSFPLILALLIEGVLGALMCSPKPFCIPPINLARWSYQQVGATVVMTIASVFGLLLLSPLYDLVVLSRSSQRSDAGLEIHDEAYQARAELNLVLLVANVGALFLLRILGRTIGELDHKNVSEAALLKQVRTTVSGTGLACTHAHACTLTAFISIASLPPSHSTPRTHIASIPQPPPFKPLQVRGLQKEYTRMIDTNGAVPAGPSTGAEGAELAALRARLLQLQQEREEAAGRAAAAGRQAPWHLLNSPSDQGTVFRGKSQCAFKPLSVCCCRACPTYCRDQPFRAAHPDKGARE
jgi:hypothetical protein